MVVLYQTTDAGNSIRNYNRNYNRKNNKLGIMQIVDENGTPIFRTEEAEIQNTFGYNCVRTPLELENATWYIESQYQDLGADAGFPLRSPRSFCWWRH